MREKKTLKTKTTRLKYVNKIWNLRARMQRRIKSSYETLITTLMFSASDNTITVSEDQSIEP